MKDYRSTWNAPMILEADPAVMAGKWVEIGKYTVEAGLYYIPGYGYSTSQSDADGRVFAQFMTTGGSPTEVTGILRIAAYTPDDLPIQVLFESRTETLNSSATDRTKQLPFPAMQIGLGEDYKYVFFFMADTNATISKAGSKLLIDITKRSKSM